MLGSIRKFSSTIFAKVFLFIVAIPFVFWGMGDLFRGGNQNTIVKIGKEKIPTQEFIDYLKIYTPPDQILNKNLIEKLFSNFIGEKLIDIEMEDLKIVFTNNALSDVIKNEKNFKKDDKFSRVEYEKFLIKNNFSAVNFERNLSKQLKKKQFFDLIGGGIVTPNFLVGITFDRINQKRNIELIDLNDIFKKKVKISEQQILAYYDKNKNSYTDVYKSFKFIKLSPKNLTGSKDYDDLFFQKIDTIDDFIVNGKNLEFILDEFDLGPSNLETVSESKKNKNFSDELVEIIFNIDQDAEPVALIENNNEYFIFEIIKSEKSQKSLNDESIKSDIVSKLKSLSKRKLISEIITKVNQQNFKKNDFNELSKKENIVIKKIKLKNINDDKTLKKDLVKQIYEYPEKQVIAVTDLDLSESYLVYIDQIENVSIDEKSEDFEKYLNLSKVRMTNNLYNTFDNYLRKKYEVDINYKALDKVRNYIE